jgi:transposase-like protein
LRDVALASSRSFSKSSCTVSPETVTIDKSGSNLAALHVVNAERETPIKVRQVKYLNNVVEQDHRHQTSH